MNVCVVVIYLGELPIWMPIYLKTCYSSSIDFKIFTDSTEYESKNNVEFIELSKKDLIKEIKNIGFSIKDVSPRKLCDWRVFSGLMFADKLEGYDYWGIGDLDVFYGDGSKFINEEAFKECDLFSTRRRFMAGHGSFFRNDPRVNNLFFEIPQIKGIMEDARYRRVDEVILTEYLKGKKEFKVVRKNIIASDTFHGAHRLTPFSYCWNNGVLTNNKTKKEYFYVHFLRTKRLHTPTWEFQYKDLFFLNRSGVSYQ